MMSTSAMHWKQSFSSSSSSSSFGYRNKLTSPIICEGESTLPAFTACTEAGGAESSEVVTGVTGAVEVEVEVTTEVTGWQIIKVSLSWEDRHDCWFSYSSSRVRGSEAVAAWIALLLFVSFSVCVFSCSEERERGRGAE